MRREELTTKHIVSVSVTLLNEEVNENNIENFLDEIENAISSQYASEFERTEYEIENEEYFHVRFEFIINAICNSYCGNLLEPPDTEVEFDEDLDNLDIILKKSCPNMQFHIMYDGDYEIVN